MTDFHRPTPAIAVSQVQRRSQALKVKLTMDPLGLDEETTDVGAEALKLVEETVECGAFVEQAELRLALSRVVSEWSRWLSSNRSSPPIPRPLAQFVPGELQEISVKSLLEELARGNSVHRRLIKDGDFRDSNVRRSDLVDAFASGKVVDCRFEKCNFESAEFGPEVVTAGAGADFIYVAFVECNFRRVRWPGARAFSLAFEDAPDLYASDFEGATFADVLFRNFGGAKLGFGRANFTDCKFSGARFSQSDFQGAIFSRCIFDETTFSGCDMSLSAFHACEFEGVQIAGGTLERSLLAECGLQGVELIKGENYGGAVKDYPLMSDVRYETSHNVSDHFEMVAQLRNDPSPEMTAEDLSSSTDR